MEKSEAISRFTLDEIKKRHAAQGWKSDCARVRALSERELERAIADDPDADIGSDGAVYIPVAPDLAEWLAGQGSGPIDALDTILRKAKMVAGQK